MLLICLFLIWWGFTLWVGMATRALQPSRPIAAPAPPPPALPAPELEAGGAAVSLVPTGNPRATFRHSTPEEIAEAQRRADEAMRVLAPNTHEVMRMPRKAE